MSLVHGTWDVKNEHGLLERVRPQDIQTTALLTIEGELDDISGSGQTRAAHDLCTGIVGTEQTHFEAKGAGHYGIFSGRRWRELVYPEVKHFIAKHHGLTAPSHATKTTTTKAAAPKSPIPKENSKKVTSISTRAKPQVSRTVAKKSAAHKA
jgi:poly(3-hydroxybutyrate) depolymerase